MGNGRHGWNLKLFDVRGSDAKWRDALRALRRPPGNRGLHHRDELGKRLAGRDIREVFTGLGFFDEEVMDVRQGTDMQSQLLLGAAGEAAFGLVGL